jgi:hypothetical protein
MLGNVTKGFTETVVVLADVVTKQLRRSWTVKVLITDKVPPTVALDEDVIVVGVRLVDI